MRAFAHQYNKGVNRGTPMPMPSLFRYFVVVGSALTGLLLLVNYMFAPPPEPAMAAVAPATITVRHDPRASIIERWRNEQAARKAAERGELPAIAAAPEPATPVSEPSPTRPEPPQIVAPVALHTAATEPDAAEETRKAEQIKAAQAARKARIARARARRQEPQDAASRQQDQFYYGTPSHPQDPFTYGAARRAYADPPAFGPFGGRTW